MRREVHLVALRVFARLWMVGAIGNILCAAEPPESTGAPVARVAENATATIPPPTLLQSGLTALAEGRNDDAASLLGNLVAEYPDAPECARAMCGTAQALGRLGRHGESLEFFEAALARHDATLQAGPLHLAAAVAAVRAQLWPRAIAHCEYVHDTAELRTLLPQAYPLWITAKQATGNLAEALELLQAASTLDEVDQAALTELALRIGLAAMTANQTAVATTALRWYLDHATLIQNSPAASEGLAWATALTATEGRVAAEALEQLVETHPTVPSAAQALVAAAAYRLQQADQAAARANLAKLQQDYANTAWTPAQWSAIAETAERSGDQTLAVAARKHALDATAATPASAQAAADALLTAAQADDAALFAAAAGVLARADHPQAIHRALTGLVDAGLERYLGAVLEQWIQPASSSCKESAASSSCQWLAAKGRWDLLAAQAVRHDSPDRLCPEAQRWIAEGLTALGRHQEAYRWIEAAANHPERTASIDLLLRGTELALLVRPREEVERWMARMEPRIDCAETQARVDLLKAEKEMRAAAFDLARALLEPWGRSATIDGAIAGRAQWLIGETYFMQGRFEDAVHAYQGVEHREGAQAYRPLALVQAGKCFERLNRSREAAMCYSAALAQSQDPEIVRLAEARLTQLRR